MSIPWAVPPWGYRKPIYSTSPILSILSILLYLSSSQQDRALSYSIYRPGGVSYGSDTHQAG